VNGSKRNRDFQTALDLLMALFCLLNSNPTFMVKNTTVGKDVMV
jgi:hypothetical protein